MESVIKRRYVTRVLGEDLGLVKHSEIDAAGSDRLCSLLSVYLLI
jgi:hypothetical protein